MCIRDSRMFRAVDMFILPADDILCLRHGVDYLLGIVDQSADDLFNVAACCIGLLCQILDLGRNKDVYKRQAMCRLHHWWILSCPH